MSEESKMVEEELNELKHEIETFTKEKERVKNIVGKIGGVPASNTKIFNIIFFIIVVGSLIVSLISHGDLRLAMIELAVAALSIKIIILINSQAKVNHFQLWILSSIEWRLNDLIKRVKVISNDQKKPTDKT